MFLKNKDHLLAVIKEQEFNFNESIDMVKVTRMISDNFPQDWYIEEIRWWAGEYDWDLYAGYCNRNWDIVYHESLRWYMDFEDEQDLYEYLIELDKRMMERMDDIIYTVITFDDMWAHSESFRDYEKAKRFYDTRLNIFAQEIWLKDKTELEEYNHYQNNLDADNYEYRDDGDNKINICIYTWNLN